MREVKVLGVGMTRFGKFIDQGLKQLGAAAIGDALADAGIDQREIQAAFVGNAMAGLMTGQECIRGQVILRDRYAPIAGNVSMDLTMIDVTGIPGVKVGSEVVVMGEGGPTADELAALAGTIPYELLTQVGRRIPRRPVA